jgi:hypothetical protein
MHYKLSNLASLRLEKDMLKNTNILYRILPEPCLKNMLMQFPNKLITALFDKLDRFLFNSLLFKRIKCQCQVLHSMVGS